MYRKGKGYRKEHFVDNAEVAPASWGHCRHAECWVTCLSFSEFHGKIRFDFSQLAGARGWDMATPQHFHHGEKELWGACGVGPDTGWTGQQRKIVGVPRDASEWVNGRFPLWLFCDYWLQLLPLWHVTGHWFGRAKESDEILNQILDGPKGVLPILRMHQPPSSPASNLEVWLARLGFGCQSCTGVSYKARLTSVLGHHL